MSHPPPRPDRQLPLPLPLSTAPPAPVLPPDLATLRADQVWRTLPAAARAQVRGAMLRILQEAPDDADHER
jgi:hypothetical protein